MKRPVRLQYPSRLIVHQIDDRTVCSNGCPVLESLSRNVLGSLDGIDENLIGHLDRGTQGSDFQGNPLLDRKLRLDFKGNGLGRKTFSSHGELVVTGRQTPKRDVAKVIGFKCPIDSYSSTKD